jgi:hypothetical protein
MRTFLKGVSSCLKKYDRIQLGPGPTEIPLYGRSNQTAQNSGAKSKRSTYPKLQSRYSRLLHHTSCTINWPAGYGNCATKLRRHFSRRWYLFTSGQERQRRQEKAGIFQWLFQTSLQRIHSLEAKSWRTHRFRKPADSIQQHQKPYDNTGDRKDLQENGCEGWLAFPLFHPLLKAHVCIPSLQGKRLQPAAGPEAIRPFEFQNYRGLCGCDEPRYRESFGKAFYIKQKT